MAAWAPLNSYAVAPQSEQPNCSPLSPLSLTKNPSGALALRRDVDASDNNVAVPDFPHDGHSRLNCDLTKDMRGTIGLSWPSARPKQDSF
jgi:hypothetical protein